MIIRIIQAVLFPILMSIVAFKAAEYVKETRPEINIRPEYYLVSGFIFGPFAILWCWNKKRKLEKYNVKYRKSNRK